MSSSTCRLCPRSPLRYPMKQPACRNRLRSSSCHAHDHLTAIFLAKKRQPDQNAPRSLRPTAPHQIRRQRPSSVVWTTHSWPVTASNPTGSEAVWATSSKRLPGPTDLAATTRWTQTGTKICPARPAMETVRVRGRDQHPRQGLAVADLAGRTVEMVETTLRHSHPTVPRRATNHMCRLDSRDHLLTHHRLRRPQGRHLRQCHSHA